jgi:hypothetical protein
MAGIDQVAECAAIIQERLLIDDLIFGGIDYDEPVLERSLAAAALTWAKEVRAALDNGLLAVAQLPNSSRDKAVLQTWFSQADSRVSDSPWRAESSLAVGETDLGFRLARAGYTRLNGGLMDWLREILSAVEQETDRVAPPPRVRANQAIMLALAEARDQPGERARLAAFSAREWEAHGIGFGKSAIAETSMFKELKKARLLADADREYQKTRHRDRAAEGKAARRSRRNPDPMDRHNDDPNVNTLLT